MAHPVHIIYTQNCHQFDDIRANKPLLLAAYEYHSATCLPAEYSTTTTKPLISVAGAAVCCDGCKLKPFKAHKSQVQSNMAKYNCIELVQTVEMHI